MASRFYKMVFPDGSKRLLNLMLIRRIEVNKNILTFYESHPAFNSFVMECSTIERANEEFASI
jgi:hypothetical protein